MSDTCSHMEFVAPRILDFRSRHLENSRDLVVLEHHWIAIVSHFNRQVEWKLPVPRVRYLALTYTTRFHESFDSQLLAAARLFRFRVEVLYILINPDEFDDDCIVARYEMERNKVKARRKVLETPFAKREGAESLIARAPDSFWYGPREYYAFTWDHFEEKMMGSQRWRKFSRAIEKARKMEKNCCTGCQNPRCERRADTYPAIWKIMSWRDPQ